MTSDRNTEQPISDQRLQENFDTLRIWLEMLTDPQTPQRRKLLVNVGRLAMSIAPEITDSPYPFGNLQLIANAHDELVRNGGRRTAKMAKCIHQLLKKQNLPDTIPCLIQAIRETNDQELIGIASLRIIAEKYSLDDGGYPNTYLEDTPTRNIVGDTQEDIAA